MFTYNIIVKRWRIVQNESELFVDYSVNSKAIFMQVLFSSHLLAGRSPVTDTADQLLVEETLV